MKLVIYLGKPIHQEDILLIINIQNRYNSVMVDGFSVSGDFEDHELWMSKVEII